MKVKMTTTEVTIHNLPIGDPNTPFDLEGWIRRYDIADHQTQAESFATTPTFICGSCETEYEYPESATNCEQSDIDGTRWGTRPARTATPTDAGAAT